MSTSVAEFLRAWAVSNREDKQHILKVVTVWSALIQFSLHGLPPDQSNWNERQQQFWLLLNRPIP